MSAHEPDARWAAVALEPPRAHGPPPARGRLRTEAEDFRVEEQLGFAPDGEGAHVLLRVEKRNANTEWVARQLAQFARCRAAEVGYAGLKDRRALAVQWFSVPATHRSAAAWSQLRGEGFSVLDAVPHRRKLPRGALAGNHFRIVIRELTGATPALDERLERIGERGVPNYFGPQRFGRSAGNLARLGEAARARRHERGLLLSSARGLLFNALTAERVQDGSWEHLECGDLAQLDGRGSFFAVTHLDAELEARCAGLEIHPTGPLWGGGAPPSSGRVLERELAVAAAFAEPCELVVAAGMRQERRSLRLAVRDLTWDRGAQELTVAFRLTRGSYATAVLRELIAIAGEELAEAPGDGRAES